ncbi:MAG: hypothetical protein IIA89_11725 [Chloroflexi bacterium]|nr:hypothetical protein [Chloroflexota bacterium]
MSSSRVVISRNPLSRWLGQENLTQKASLNALAAGLDYGARLIVGFVITPLLVAGLGDYLYGAWQLLKRLMAYVSVGSGRPAQALKWTLAKNQASSDYEEKRLSVGRAVAVWLLLLPVLVVLGGLLAWFAPSLLRAPTDLTWTLRLVTGLLTANLIVVSLAGVPKAVLRGENQGYRRMGLSAVLVFLGGGLTALALYMKTGIVGVAAVVLVGTLLTGALFLRVVRTHVPWFGIARPSFESVRRFLGLSGWFLAWRLVMQLMMASDLIVLGVLTSLAFVTAYTLTKYTPEAVTSLVALVVGAITPGLGGIIGSGNLPKASRVRNEIMSLTWLVAIAIGTTIVIWNQEFVRLWVGEEHYVGSIVNLLMVLMVIQIVLIRNDAFMIDLTLDLRRKVIVGALSATLSIAAAGILMAFFNLGILGLCLGYIAGRSILSLAYPWMVGRFLGVSLHSQIKGILRPALMTALILALALGLDEYLTTSTWIGLALSVAITLVVASFLAFYTGLSGAQRRRILQRAALVTRSVRAS